MIYNALICAIYPAYSLYWVAQYAALQPTWPRKIGMFITFLPVLAFTTLMWLGAVGLLYAALRALFFPDAQ